MKVLILFIFCFSLFAMESVTELGVVLNEERSLKEGELVSLQGPDGAYKILWEWRATDLGHFKCLIYRLPREKEKGVLKLSERKEQGCSLKGFEADKTVAPDIEKLSVEKKINKSGLSYRIIVEKDNRPEITTYHFPLSGKEHARWQGIHLRAPSKERGRTLERGEACLVPDPFCQTNKRSQCQMCPEGQWTPYVTLKCMSRLSGKCGTYRCGGRGQVACVRMTSLKPSMDCEEAKQFVFCSFGREPECQSNGLITCR